MKFITTLLLIATTAIAAPKLQDADFMSSAQIQAAGGTPAQLLNDTKVWSPELLDQQSNLLMTGAMHSVMAPDLMSEFSTPANPSALKHKLYFKVDGNLYMLDSAGSEQQVNGGAAPSGTPLTFAGFNGGGSLYTIPGWSIGSNNGVTSTHTQAAAPGTLDKLYTLEGEVNPSVATNDYNNWNLTVDQHFDRSGSGNDLDGILNSTVLVQTHEGNGHVGTMNMLLGGTTLGNGAGGSADTARYMSGSTNISNNFQLDSFQVFSHNLNINPNATVTDYSGVSIGSNGNLIGNYQGISSIHAGEITGTYSGLSAVLNGSVTGNYVGVNSSLNGSTLGSYNAFNGNVSGSITGNAYVLGHGIVGNIGGSFSALSSTLTGNVGTNFGGVLVSQAGDSAGWNGMTVSQLSGNSGSVEGYRAQFGNGTSTGKSGFIAIMGDGVSSGGGRFLDASRGAGDYNNWIGLNLNPGSGDTVSTETGINLGQSSGQSGSFQGVNMVANGGGTGNFTGYSLAGSGGVSGTLKGIDINLASITTTATQKIGLTISDGAIQSQGSYDTGNLSQTPFFGSLNSIGGTLHVASGFPMTGSAFLGMNLGGLMSFDDNMGVDPFGGLLGLTNVGYFTTLRVAAGKNVDRVNSALAAFSNDAGSGTIATVDGFVSAGLISAGGTVTGITSSAFHALDGMCNQILGNCYSLRSDDNDAHLFNAGRAVLGGNYALPTEELLVNGSARVTDSVYFQEPAGINAVIMQAPAALTASYTMRLPVNMGLAGQVLTTDGINQTSWTTPGVAGTSEIFTLDGGVTFVNDINGIRRAESNETIQKIVTCLHNSGTSGDTFVKVNYGPALASAITMSVTATGGPACNSISPAIPLFTNDLMNVDVTGTATGVPTDLSVKLIF